MRTNHQDIASAWCSALLLGALPSSRNGRLITWQKNKHFSNCSARVAPEPAVCFVVAADVLPTAQQFCNSWMRVKCATHQANHPSGRFPPVNVTAHASVSTNAHVHGGSEKLPQYVGQVFSRQASTASSWVRGTPLVTTVSLLPRILYKEGPALLPRTLRVNR